MSMVIASMAYTWLIWQFVLSAHPKFIETVFGMDKPYRVHGLMAIISLAIAAIHASVAEGNAECVHYPCGGEGSIIRGGKGVH